MWKNRDLAVSDEARYGLVMRKEGGVAESVSEGEMKELWVR